MEDSVQTRGEQMLALRYARMAAAPPFLRGGFRPFFFGGSLWAVVALTLWLLALAGAVQLPTAFDPLAWHRHEMLFGFVGAVVGGFLLTAVPNWTGRLPIAGPPLAALFGLWVAGRLAVLFSAAIGAVVAAAIDVGFFMVLTAVAAREVLESKNRNLPVVGLIFLFGLVDAADHGGAAGLIDADHAWKCAVALVIILISLIGGRIIPSFTRNWLSKQGLREGLPGQPAPFDMAIIGLTAFAFLAWITAPPGWLTGTLFAVAAAGQAARLARWKGWKTFADPLVLILHVGYLWVPIGLALLAAVDFGAPIPRSTAVHALTAGAMATMILAVMSRATLGHTGRELRASLLTQAAYVLVTAGALLRVTAPLGLLDYRMGIEVAGAAWMGAFLLFLVAYGPILSKPRIDGKL
ncbi:NnrS family protein [Sphingomonas daechungensis]|uniref:NnrS family protein n=1 Tax=Sphingomonas daechungensis TaxID=1176646 RepID=UPI0031ED1D1D